MVVPADKVIDVKNTSTFTCPFCPTKNLERQGLITHVRDFHGPKSGVCPICCSEEYGDPSYVSRNLLAHMEMRHQCNYDELIDRN
mmetsp:Transcript_2912/g.4501  ORF Transcript_2912/g.4501 Transcript_2912/m.4501 type:complete len:85 (+) Transcript_2912:335-589(+)|eukprot:CAMPEP_0170478990 /NCGR_PEP_ID=MMETSP0208-20121228/382_1 /TAXON_ID=197538 /ORGANISM="Strombidium inclinatum, Strain S3" /LENGTH=84 /DNA_ID=CAMNT_0010751325 /DNA_START=335 /DNA_END=589 /DNA_ORIENTATION=+